MASTERLLENPDSIRILFQHVIKEDRKLTLGFREFSGQFSVLAEEQDHLCIMMPAAELLAWALGAGDKVSLRVEDRGLKYESVLAFEARVSIEGVDCGRFGFPRSLRRADGHRVVDFVPDAASRCTFSNARNALLDGQIKGFGLDGFELALRDPRQNIQEFMRIGEESTLDLPLEGGPHILAKTRVAYFDANVVGLKFTEQSDTALMDQYRNWLQGQQQLQVQRDKEHLDSGHGVHRTSPASLPGPRIWSDKDPMVLILTEKDDFARHMGDALGRKFGIASLDYIKGAVKPQLKELGSDEGESWGRVKMILMHNKLKVASPMELTRQLVEHEKCPLPILAVGTDEDEEVKRNRFIAAGAVDFQAVEPFKILTVLRKLDETLKLFA